VSTSLDRANIELLNCARKKGGARGKCPTPQKITCL